MRQVLSSFGEGELKAVLCSPEREEVVKADIFHAYITLLKQTRPTVSADPDAMDQEEGSVPQCACVCMCISQGVSAWKLDQEGSVPQCGCVRVCVCVYISGCA